MLPISSIQSVNVHRHSVLENKRCDADSQGHVVAEEQLRIPDSWLDDLEILDAHIAQSSDRGELKIEDSGSSVAVRNEDSSLYVEVS